MAYNIASMVEILEQDQHHLYLGCKNKIDIFLEKARCFRDAILRIPCFAGKKMDAKFTGAAHSAEDFIEAHIRNQILLLPDQDDGEFDSSLDILINLAQEFESFIKDALEIVDYDAPENQPFLPVEHLTSEQVPWYPKLDPHTRNDIPVFEDDFQTLKSRLIEEGSSKLQIISIHGEPGMGKSTLARRLYNDPLIATKFRVRAWVSSPFEINEKSCLLNLIEGLGKLTNDMHRKHVDELKVYIRNTLKNIKYFIVIHDVLRTPNLVTFTRLFRDYHVGARVIFITVFISEEMLSTCTEPYHMPLLTDDESWLLLHQKVFGREHCPDELEPIGKNIMQLCKGSPQAVSLAAGVLATSAKTPATWELVATTMGIQLKSQSTEEIQVTLLNLIYDHMPYYLRPCLLYTGAFYESRDIKASKIIKLWIAEGFIKQSKGKCLEDVAETYLGILIDKNLLFLTHQEPNGRIKAFRHQLWLKIICWFKAHKENFLGSIHMSSFFERESEETLEAKRRASAHGLLEPSNEMELPSLARSFLSMTGALERQVSVFLKMRLLRVLDVFQMEFYQFPMEIMQLVLLRYLAFSCHSYLTRSFSILRNLQTLIIRRLPASRAFSLPSDLWCLTQLRHVKCKETFILYYPRNQKAIVHENLRTLSNMQLLGVTNQFLTLIPNVRNLGIFCNITMEIAFDLACLDKLETLKCSSDWSLASRNFLACLTLPRSLRKLNLSLCRIPSEFMKLVGLLPNLEILKLQKSDFFGVNSRQNATEWETAEGDFPQLVSLEMLDLNLVHWRTKATHLPKLKQLIIRNCFAMVEIPLEIGNIQTLELILVNEASPFALVSAMQIKKEQEGRGNNILLVRTHEVI